MILNNLEDQYFTLLIEIMNHGHEKTTRNGPVKSIFGHSIYHNMSDGFPLLTTKKMYWKGIVIELLWFLRGDTNIKYLVDNDCNIWNGDAYKHYCNVASKYIEPDYDILIDDPIQKRTRLMTHDEFINKIKTDDEFAEKWGELGPIYGSQWRSWCNKTKFEHNLIDQIATLIKTLKTDPDSRRMIVSAWNVGELDSMVLPPCHYGFQVYTRELTIEERYELLAKMQVIQNSERNEADDPLAQYNVPDRAISLSWNQRSVDVFLGLPFNIASYGLLLEIIAKEVNMVPETLIANLGDCHIYNAHMKAVSTQLSRDGHDLPEIMIKDTPRAHPDDCLPYYSYSDIELIGYNSEPAIKAPLIN